MYNKLFTKILDSSIWLEPSSTRVVWVMMLAAMDEDGFCAFASSANVAHRAVVSLAEAETALRALEAPDANSSDPENDGRRLERIPGGWYVLNATKYREIVSREESKRLQRERQRRHRALRPVTVTPCHATSRSVTVSDVSVTQSEADTEAYTEAVDQTLLTKSPRKERAEMYSAEFDAFWQAYPKRTGKGAAWKAWTKAKPPLQLVLDSLAWQIGQPQWTRENGQFIPHASTWLKQRRWEDEAFHPPQDLTPQRGDTIGVHNAKVGLALRAARERPIGLVDLRRIALTGGDE